MVALTKARDIDGFLANPDFKQPVILLYGQDHGLVAERADKLAVASGVDLSDPFSLIRLNADDVAADTARLADEAHTIGMFGGNRLIRISGSTRKDLSKCIQPVLDTPPEDAIIVIEAGELRRTSGLYKQFAAAKTGLSIACYQDNDQALNQLIDEEIVKNDLSIDRDTRLELKSMLGANRMVSRGELRKLALYCHGKQTVSLEDVRNIVGDASQLAIDDVVDAVAAGNPTRLHEKLPKALETNFRADIILLTVIRHFQMLHVARNKMDTNRQPASSIVKSMRPPIHFSRADAVGRALSAWPVDRLSRALSRLDQTMLNCRQNSDAADSIAGTTLLALCLEARGLAKRR